VKETAQQYIARITGYLEGRDPVAILAAWPRKYAALVKGASKRALSRRPLPDKWSVTEILAHLADVELVQGFRIRMILGAPGTPLQGFDQDAWAREGGYASHDPALSLATYLALRKRTLALLRGLSKEQWDRHGMHAERGKETVRRVTEMMAGHDINHERQVRAILKAPSRR
jgi:hypothetical protein